MIDPGLTGRIAVVMGANHGIGAAIAVALARQGAHVFLNYFRWSAGDIANAVVFLASDQADWITGQVLYVGGGDRM